MKFKVTKTQHSVPIHELCNTLDKNLTIYQTEAEAIEAEMHNLVEQINNTSDRKLKRSLFLELTTLGRTLSLFHSASTTLSICSILLRDSVNSTKRSDFVQLKEKVELQDQKVAETLLPIKEALEQSKNSGRRNERIYG